MDLTHTILHENRWHWGKTIQVVSCYGEAIVEMSFSDDNAGVCYISGLSVTQPIRKKGVATKLMQFCESYCMSHHIFRIDLNSVLEQFVMDFYHKLGYEDIKESDGFMMMYKLLPNHAI